MAGDAVAKLGHILATLDRFGIGGGGSCRSRLATVGRMYAEQRSAQEAQA
ncbi:hypothetical protein C4K40_5172 [Pseudomonas sp. CMR5c]|nr:hypothetical protein C4K40_5172 [Pseudomonas sp. CMR5c]